MRWKPVVRVVLGAFIVPAKDTEQEALERLDELVESDETYYGFISKVLKVVRNSDEKAGRGKA